MAIRMTRSERRAQVLEIAAREFADHGLHGASTEKVAREAGITQAYVFRMFKTKKALFLEVVGMAFDEFVDGMHCVLTAPPDYGRLPLWDRSTTSCSPAGPRCFSNSRGSRPVVTEEVRAVVRAKMARMWHVVDGGTGLDPVTVKTFLAFGMLLNAGAALDVAEVNEPWAHGLRTSIRPGLFEHITGHTNE